MQSMTVSTLGFNLNTSVPASVDEYDALAKKVGACLESATLNVIYRSVLAKFRSAFSDAVENNTGIKRLTEATGKKIKEEDGTEVDQMKFTETEKVYFDRVCAAKTADGTFASAEAAAASFQTLAQTTLDSITFDPSESEKAPAGPKKVAKAYTTVAEKALADGKLASLAATLQTKLGNWTVDGTSVDSVARAISEDQRRKREAANLSAEYAV